MKNPGSKRNVYYEKFSLKTIFCIFIAFISPPSLSQNGLNPGAFFDGYYKQAEQERQEQAAERERARFELERRAQEARIQALEAQARAAENELRNSTKAKPFVSNPTQPSNELIAKQQNLNPFAGWPLILTGSTGHQYYFNPSSHKKLMEFGMQSINIGILRQNGTNERVTMLATDVACLSDQGHIIIITPTAPKHSASAVKFDRKQNIPEGFDAFLSQLCRRNDN